MTLIRRRAPALFRAFDAATQVVGWKVVSLDIEDVCASAEATTGLCDYGHPGFLNRLTRMLASAASHRDLTTTGRIAQRIFFQWHVTNRLKEIELLKQYPEIVEIPVPAPVIVVGGYRTGTTHLHTLLSQDERFRAPRTWELAFQVTRPLSVEQDREVRRRNARAVFGLNQVLMPDQSQIHELLIDGPEECHFLLENAALSMTHYISFQGYDYARWLLSQDVRDAYESMKVQYQILSWSERRENPDAPLRPWLLKCPLHIWYLNDLMAVLPDARLIWTHRAMRATLPSTCGLTAVTASKFFKQLDGSLIGEFWASYYERGLERGLGERDAHPEWNVLDVHLRELSADPEGGVARIYEHLGIEHSDAARANVALYLERQKAARDAPGEHRYKCEEFGFSAEEIDERFGAYHRRFDVI